MDALLAAIMSMFKEDASKDFGGAQGMGNMQNLMSQIGTPTAPQAAPSPHDFAPPAQGVPAAPAPNPYASALSFSTQPSTSPALPTPQPLNMQQPRMGNLGMPNSQMMPMNGQMSGQQLAAQAYGRYY
jgi:hypothetical protein